MADVLVHWDRVTSDDDGRWNWRRGNQVCQVRGSGVTRLSDGGSIALGVARRNRTKRTGIHQLVML